MQCAVLRRPCPAKCNIYQRCSIKPLDRLSAARSLGKVIVHTPLWIATCACCICSGGIFYSAFRATHTSLDTSLFRLVALLVLPADSASSQTQIKDLLGGVIGSERLTQPATRAPVSPCPHGECHLRHKAHPRFQSPAMHKSAPSRLAR